MLSKPMCVNWSSRHNERRGQSVVEFAFVMPVLVLLFAGIVDLGNGFQTYIALTNAAREGAYYGANPNGVGPTVCDRARLALPSTISITCPGDVTVTYPAVAGDANCPGGSAQVGCPIRVKVTYSLSTWLGGVLGFNTITLSPSIDMMVLAFAS